MKFKVTLFTVISSRNTFRQMLRYIEIEYPECSQRFFSRFFFSEIFQFARAPY